MIPPLLRRRRPLLLQPATVVTTEGPNTVVTTEGPNTALRRLADRHDSFSVFCRDVFLYIEELRSKSNLHQHVVHLFEQLHVFLRQFRAWGV